ncbi:MAG: NAD-dependent epimerase/dehydratase family protein, partial [Thermoanaerobaculia bacterium]
ILEHAGHKPQIRFRPEMPTGPLNRVADNSLARRLLTWEPAVLFREGVCRTMDWYFSSKDRDQVKAVLDRMLTER